MPRCAARHVKLVAEAEQLVLPFLAPRVFQPWPQSPLDSSPTAPAPYPRTERRSFSTTSCGCARQSRSSQPQKYESARSLLVQQWYESAIAPADQEDVQKEHVRDGKDAKQKPEEPTRTKRSLTRADVQKAYYQRWSTSQALVKSRWTVAKGDQKVRTKWSPLGRPVRRKAREEGAENKDEIVFSADGNALYWNHHFAKLNARHDTALTHDFTPRATPNLIFLSRKWAIRILSAKKFGDLEEMATLLGRDWRRKWMHALLWTMANSIDDTIRLLEITHLSPYLPAAYITDALAFVVQHHAKYSISDDTRKHLVHVICTIMERPGTTPLQITGNTLRRLLQLCTEDEISRLFESVVLSGTLLHWNTRLHYSTYLAHHGRFDQALDMLLDAVSDGADVGSRQFESCCATILRKAADQPDGLRVSLRLVQNLSDIGVTLNVQLCNIVMLNAVEANDLKTAFSIYHSLVDNDLHADEYTHAILLKGCKTVIENSETLNTTIRQAIADVEVRNLNVVATEIVHCLCLHHFQIDPENAFTTVSEAYTQLFDTEALVNLGILPQRYMNKSMNRMKPTIPVLGIMVAAHLQNVVQSQSRNIGHIHELYRRWRSLVEHDVRPHGHTANKDYIFNSFLMAFVQDPTGLSYAAEVIRDMQTPLPNNRSQAKPSVRTWSIFLHGFAKHGKMELAEQVLTYMREKNMKPNEVTWNSLIGGYARLGKSNETVETFVRMRDEGFEADTVTQRHFGKIKLDSVRASAWGSSEQKKQSEQQAESKEAHGQQQIVDEQKVDDKADSTNELVDGVYTLSV